MKSRDFAFWLQGFFELTGPETSEKGLTPHQAKLVQAHLSLVFQHDAEIAVKPHPNPAPQFGVGVAGDIYPSTGALVIC